METLLSSETNKRTWTVFRSLRRKKNVNDRFYVWNHRRSQFRPTGPPFTSLSTDEASGDKVPCLGAQAGKPSPDIVDRDVNGGPIGWNWLRQGFHTLNLSFIFLFCKTWSKGWCHTRHVALRVGEVYSTGCSQAVTQPSSNWARRCSTSVIDGNLSFTPHRHNWGYLHIYAYTVCEQKLNALWMWAGFFVVYISQNDLLATGVVEMPDMSKLPVTSINLSISIAPISPTKPGSAARQPNQCPTAESKKQFRNINGPSGVPVSVVERPSQRDVYLR